LRILFVSSEAYPLIKTGGLADVSGSLPAALRESGADIRILIPGYPAVLQNLINTQPLATMSGLPYIESATLLLGEMPDTKVPVIAIQCEALYERDGGPYVDSHGKDWDDNPLRFGILSLLAARLSCEDSPVSDWIPDIVHCNDWQAGLTPAYLRFMDQVRAKSIFSIHNMAFQGTYSAEWVSKLQLPAESYQMHGLEYYGRMSFLKAGAYYADAIATVSPTYALEMQTEAYGFGMQGLIASRSHEVHGILNGIETHEWNPAADPHIAKPYDDKNLVGKKHVKQALQTQLGLTVNDTAPLLGVVSRLTHQKGLDMLLEIAGPLLEKGCQLAVLGNGERELENGFKSLAVRYPQKVSAVIGYNEPLSHKIMAGVDMFIMPSRFEPCGLNQMYGMRYGTPPIVTSTGGLADSVTDTNTQNLRRNTATGFVLKSPTAHELLNTIEHALTYYADVKTWKKIQRNGMRRDLSWKESAGKYMELYSQTLVKK